ncbi:Leucine-rich repeat neuronal protein 3 [Mactra antiquata]
MNGYIINIEIAVLFLLSAGYLNFTNSETTPLTDCHLKYLKEETFSRDTVSVSVTDCTSESFKNILCQICDFHQSVIVNVSWNKIHYIDDVECNCSGIDEIDLSNNDLSTLEANSFAFIQSARSIRLEQNHIYQVKEHAFIGMEKLEILDLSRNVLKYINLNSFVGAVNLQELNLSHNKLTKIAKNIFKGLSSLEIINLSFNCITHLDNLAFNNLEKLKTINLAGNKLAQFKLDFVLPSLNLNELDLSGNLFPHFENESLNNFEVRKLILSGLEHLEYILDGSFRNSEFLQIVNLSHCANLLFMEDGAFVNTPNLLELDVGYTKLKSVSKVYNDVTVNSKNLNLLLNGRQFCNDSIDISNLYEDTSVDNSNITHNATGADIQNSSSCPPVIISEIKPVYHVYVGQTLQLQCFAIGHLKPYIYWEHVQFSYDGIEMNSQFIRSGYFLNLSIHSLSTAGRYKCVAENGNQSVTKLFNVSVRHIDIGIRVLNKNSHSVLITWTRPHHAIKYVVMHRAYEKVSSYMRQNIRRYWKVFLITSLQPSTEYEICIASFSDDSDKNCIRTRTEKQSNPSRGIHHNTLVITVLSIAGFLIILFILTTLYRCADKIRVIRRHSVFIVGSSSRECFAEVSSDNNYTFENHHTDFLVEPIQKTQL